jgi:hypothetical protein
MLGTLFKRFCERVALFGDGRVFVRDLAGTTWDVTAEWQALRDEIEAERCENCACWDSDPSSAPEVNIPTKSHARVCFALTIQDVYGGMFQATGAVLTKAEFCCSHFEKKEPE